MDKKRITDFQRIIWNFYKKNKRSFPWRTTKDPYKILVSEIMLQQTQADRVVRYYEKWLERFPNFASLSRASFNEMYSHWQGLGYNRRALALKKIAGKTIKEFRGKLPSDPEILEMFPGIGKYTAAAIAAFAFNKPVVCIETNIRRVFIHEFFPLRHGSGQARKINDQEILIIAQQALDIKNPREWHWALMDYGAYLKNTLRNTQGKLKNPNRRAKNYTVQSKFEGSLRQIRGTALKMLSARPMSQKELISRIKKATSQTPERIKKVILNLKKEDFIKYKTKGKIYYLN